MSEIIVPDPDNLSLDSLKLNSPAQVNRSGWTGKRKVIGQPGMELWQGQATIDMIATEADERPWRAFLFALRGPTNWFNWPLPCNLHLGNKPTVGSGASNGYTLPLTGLQPSIHILHAGQFITVPLPSGYPRPVCLITDLIADSSGNATAVFEPALSETPANGTVVETVDPFVRMAMTDSTTGFDTSNGVSGVTFAVEEAR